MQSNSVGQDYLYVPISTSPSMGVQSPAPTWYERERDEKSGAISRHNLPLLWLGLRHFGILSNGKNEGKKSKNKTDRRKGESYRVPYSVRPPIGGQQLFTWGDRAVSLCDFPYGKSDFLGGWGEGENLTIPKLRPSLQGTSE